MLIEDTVYGKEEIKEQVLVELISSATIQRLKKISQFGMPAEYFHLPVFSRYDHSVGVLIFLRRLGADIKEQIAGLLHDVSHTAFSHVIDWVLGNPSKEDYQDKMHFEFIKDSEIPYILAKYGFDFHEVCNPKNFSLLERESPSLCADRVDYALREFALRFDPEIAKTCFKSLLSKNNCIVFNSVEPARIFSDFYSRCQKENWGSDQAKSRYHILSEILKRAIFKETVTMRDLKKTDREVISLLENSNDDEILSGLNLLKNGFKTEETENEGIILQKKFRYVDPEILINNSIKRLSEIDLDYKNYINKEKEISSNPSKVRIVPLNTHV
ncbi:HD domain-containing protein [Candidatus Woesearchaeota archaeon]|nr:HD domain-containing protein [Candidatus Woesearchaeota archaeon]